MKSSFLISLILTCFVTTTVLAQTTATTPATAEEGSSFDKFYERLKMSYFGAYTGSSVNNWDNMAVDEEAAKTADNAHNLFNQISFNYNFGAKLNFVFNPRWTVYTGRTTGHGTDNTGMLNLEDFLAGFQGAVYNTEDKKFTYWTRLALRLPTSRASRKDDITYQPDWMNILTYDFNTKWQLGQYIGLRQWVYEQRHTAFRYRVYVAPYIQYAVNDTTKLALWYENYSENRRHLQSQKTGSPHFKKYWETVMVSVAKDITPKLNFMPFLAYHINSDFADEKPLDATGLGFWLSYQIK